MADKRIIAVVGATGASLTDVVRTRIYLANIDQWQDVGRVQRGAWRHQACHDHGRSEAADRSGYARGN